MWWSPSNFRFTPLENCYHTYSHLTPNTYPYNELHELRSNFRLTLWAACRSVTFRIHSCYRMLLFPSIVLLTFVCYNLVHPKWKRNMCKIITYMYMLFPFISVRCEQRAKVHFCFVRLLVTANACSQLLKWNAPTMVAPLLHLHCIPLLLECRLFKKTPLNIIYF